MGLFSGVAKGFKKISKGIKKLGGLSGKFLGGFGLKKVWKEVKRAWNTKLGRALLIGAAIWATGGLLAMHFGIAQGASAFTLSNSMAGLSQAGSVLAGKVGLSGVSKSLAVAPAQVGPEAAALAAEGAGSAAAAQTGANAALGIEQAVGVAPEVVAGAAPTSGGIMAAAGNFATKHPLLTYGLLQTGGQMVAAANTPTQAEEYRDILRHTQRANNITGMAAPMPGGDPSARFVAPTITPRRPQAIPPVGLLTPNTGGF